MTPADATDLGHRVDRARKQLEQLRERLSASSAGDHPSVAEPLQRLDEELDSLHEVAQRIAPTLALLRLIVTAHDHEEMVRRAATYLRDWSGVDAVGIRLREGEDFPYYVTSGFSKGFVARETSLLAVDRDGRPARNTDGRVELQCMCGRVIRGAFDPSSSFFSDRGSFWTNSISELLRTAAPEQLGGPTRNHCHAAGYESVALVPLRQGADTFGLIQLNDHATDRFSPDRIEVLEEIADYLAAALD